MRLSARPRVSRRAKLTAAVAVGILALGALGSPPPAAALIPTPIPYPDSDPFYAQPPNIGAYRPGDILAVRKVTAIAYVLPVPARTWQIKYRSSDNNGKPTANVTTLMVPQTAWTGPGARPLVSYQTAEDSAGTQCAPSYGLRAGIAAGYGGSETGQIVLPLLRNWAVVVPDYQGPDSQLLGGRAEAHGVLDSLRAVRKFSSAGLSHSPIGITGFSGGGAATAFTAKFQRAYAPELPIKGIVLGGVVADIHATAKQFNLVGSRGALIMGLAALDRAYPAANLPGYLNSRGQKVLNALSRECIIEANLKYPFLNPAVTLDALTKQPRILENPKMVRFLESISPLNMGQKPMAPVFGYVALGDELAPIGPARKLFRQFCAQGIPVQTFENPIGEHFTESVIDYPRGLAFLAERFASETPRSDCGRYLPGS